MISVHLPRGEEKGFGECGREEEKEAYLSSDSVGERDSYPPTDSDRWRRRMKEDVEEGRGRATHHQTQRGEGGWERRRMGKKGEGELSTIKRRGEKGDGECGREEKRERGMATHHQYQPL